MKPLSRTFRSNDPLIAARWIERRQGEANLYFSVNRPRYPLTSKATKADIGAMLALHVDVDPAPGQDLRQEQSRIEEAIRRCTPHPSVIVFTGGGYGAFWLLQKPEPVVDVEASEAYNQQIAAELGGDHCHNIDRIMRLPGTFNLPDAKKRAKGRVPALARVVKADWDARYRLDDFEPAAPRPKPNGDAGKTWPTRPLPDWVEQIIKSGDAARWDGDRSDAVFAVCCEMVRCGCGDEEITDVLLHANNGISAHVLEQNNPERCAKRQADRARQKVAQDQNSTSARPSAASQSAPKVDDPSWPEALSPAAYHGLAGEIIRAIEPHTEADPAALLAQFLTAFGNIVGRRAYYRVEGTRHYANLFVVLVGDTAKARKGTSWDRIRGLFETLPDGWARDRVESGMSTGEGLIWQVRDAIKKVSVDKDSGETTEEVIDPGIWDKRLTVVESEFAGVLRVMERSGSILSRIIRDSWDRGDIGTMIKNSPARATGAHISIIGHITRDELRRYLTATEAANGFANRFLFICARRSNVLPFGGDLDQRTTDCLASALKQRVEAACSGERRVDFDEAARVRWGEVYPDLSEAGPGMLGAVTARAEAQVVRLALIYALLDGADAIGLPHLEAALAIWGYADASAAHIFGDSLGDDVADTILAALRSAEAKGLTRSQIGNLFSRHQSAERIARALAMLAREGFATMESKETGGRPSEIWRVM